MDAANKPFTKTVRTLELCSSGARIARLDVVLKVDDTIGVQHGTEKARFRVASIGEPGTPEAGILELDCLQPEKNIWGEIKPDQPAPPPAPTPVAPTLTPANHDLASQSDSNRERRRFERYSCEIGVVVQPEGGGERLWARCTDISHGGCYLETWSPLAVGARLLIMLDGMEVDATVSTCHPGVGMGVSFLKSSAPDRIGALVSRYSANEAHK